MRLTMLLSLVPDTHGRSAAGVSRTRSGHAAPTATIAAPPAASWRMAATRPRGATHSPRRRQRRLDEQRRGHLRLEPEADGHAGEHEPARPPVLERAHDEPQRRDRAQDQERVGVVVARDGDRDRLVATPATNPAARPNRRRVRSYTSATEASPMSACGSSRLNGW